jgi:hypothetical protein
MILNYDRKTFTVQATGRSFKQRIIIFARIWIESIDFVNKWLSKHRQLSEMEYSTFDLQIKWAYLI